MTVDGVGVRVLGLILACLAVAAAPKPAAASETIIGGHAEACSKSAKAGLYSPEAIETCTLAISTDLLSPHLLAATYVNRGTMFEAASNYGSALLDFDQAVMIEPGLGVAYVNRGGALVGLRRYKEAEVEIDKGLALNPEEPEKAYCNRALARWSQDNLKGAYADFQMAAQLKPDWAWPKEQLTHFTVSPKQAVAEKEPHPTPSGPPSP
jgi:tetratricopeptide (TPR) repeat protein